MSFIYALTISLKPSIDFRRLGCFLISTGMFSLIYADSPFGLSFIIAIWMMHSLFGLMKSPKPHPHLQSIRFHNGQWLLQEKGSPESRYEHVHISVDTGFFLLLRFSNTEKARFITLFYDQMSKDELRAFQILYTIL